MASSFVPYIPSDGDSSSIKIITSRVSTSIPANSRNNTFYPSKYVLIDVPDNTLFAMVRQTSAATITVTALNSSAESFGYGVVVQRAHNYTWTFAVIHDYDDHTTNIPIGSTHVETFPATSWNLIDEDNAYASISGASAISIALNDRYAHRNENINWSNTAFNFEVLFATAVV